jgi:hypothetical protein
MLNIASLTWFENTVRSPLAGESRKNKTPLITRISLIIAVISEIRVISGVLK